MPDKRSGGRSRSLMEATGLVAIYATRRVMQIVWKKVTGHEPPSGPADRETPLGQAVVWALLLGAFATTARMIAIRYAIFLLPRRQRQKLAEAAGRGEGLDNISAPP